MFDQITWAFHLRGTRIDRPVVDACYGYQKNHWKFNLEELEKVFESADKNGDGKLSVEELYDQLKLAGLLGMK